VELGLVLRYNVLLAVADWRVYLVHLCQDGKDEDEEVLQGWFSLRQSLVIFILVRFQSQRFKNKSSS
jgi:hypothetical protein